MKTNDLFTSKRMLRFDGGGRRFIKEKCSWKFTR